MFHSVRPIVLNRILCFLPMCCQNILAFLSRQHSQNVVPKRSTNARKRASPAPRRFLVVPMSHMKDVGVSFSGLVPHFRMPQGLFPWNATHQVSSLQKGLGRAVAMHGSSFGRISWAALRQPFHVLYHLQLNFAMWAGSMTVNIAKCCRIRREYWGLL